MNENYLVHYGTPKHSGRYPWGSGNRPYQSEENSATYAEKKAQALKSGSAKEILQYKGDLTNQEMQTALSRLNLEKQLSDISARETTTNAKRLESFTKTLGNVANFAEQGTKVYNAVAKVSNAFSNEKKLPLIGQESKDKNKDKDAKKISDKARKLINSGQYQTILNNSSQFTTDEIQETLTRMSKIEDLKKKVSQGIGS